MKLLTSGRLRTKHEIHFLVTLHLWSRMYPLKEGHAAISAEEKGCADMSMEEKEGCADTSVEEKEGYADTSVEKEEKREGQREG